MGPRKSRNEGTFGTNKSKWNVISISVPRRFSIPRSPSLFSSLLYSPRRSSRVFSARSPGTSPFSFPLPFQGNCDPTGYIRKTFNPAPLNTSDIKSYSIVGMEEWKVVNNPLRFFQDKKEIGLEVERTGSGETYQVERSRSNREISFFFCTVRLLSPSLLIPLFLSLSIYLTLSPSSLASISRSRKKRQVCIWPRQGAFDLISFSRPVECRVPTQV